MPVIRVAGVVSRGVFCGHRRCSRARSTEDGGVATRPMLPQGTGPLEAAAFAAAMLQDVELVEFLTARVENKAVDEHRFGDFLTEIR